jgi:hypothetical protein
MKNVTKGSMWMKKKIIGMLVVCFVFLQSTVFAAAAKKGVQNNGNLKVTAKAVVSKTIKTSGTLELGSNSTLVANNVTLNNTTVKDAKGATYTTSGVLNPNQNTLHINNEKLTLSGGNFDKVLTAEGTATLEGIGSFATSSKIQLANAASTLELAIDSPINANIYLNGGTAIAKSDIKLTDKAVMTNGLLNVNGRKVNVKGNNLKYKGAKDIELSTKTTLTGELLFLDDTFLSANGNVVDISYGGILHVAPTTTLFLSNLVLRGLGTGSIVLDGLDSHVVLSNVDIELNENYTVTWGGIYVEGPANVITHNYTLSFDQAASLTVDAMALTYDTLDTPNANNIQPLMIDDPQQAHVISLDGGVIRHISSSGGSAGDIHLTGDTQFDGLKYIYPDSRLFIDADLTLDGDTNLVLFSKSDAGTPLFFVADNKTAYLQNISLEYFSPDILNLGTGSKIIYGDNTKIDMTKDESLVGEMLFNGVTHLAGHGNIFDISAGAKLHVGPASTLFISDMTLYGLGSGDIVLDGLDSRVVLSNVNIEMDNNYTITWGGIYAQGPTNIVTRDYTLLFDQAGSLTVDGIGLSYDTLDMPDADNIQPVIAPDPASHVISLNGGIIRQVGSANDPITDVHFTTNSWLDGLFAVYPGHRVFIDEDLTLNGSTNLMLFSKSDATMPLLFVAADKTGVLENISLEYFSPDLVSLDTNASLIFGDKTKMSFAKNETLDETWVFQGNCVLNGEDHVLTLGPSGNIVIDGAGSSLLIENAIIKGVAGTNITCNDNTCTVSFNNVTWIQEGSYTFATGRFDVLSNFEISAPFGQFVYASNMQSSIVPGATMTLAKGSTFYYAPSSSTDRDLIKLVDESSTIVMNGATLLSSSPVGMRLTKGQLVLDDKNYVSNDATTVSEAISFGMTGDPLYVSIMPGASINVIAGILDWNDEPTV